MQCPTCRKALISEIIHKVDINSCPSCSGIWLEKGKLNQLVDEKNRMVEFNTIDHDPLIHGDKNPGRACPACGKTMKKVDLLEDSRIIFDYCPGCRGFWLDKGELEQTRQYLARFREKGGEIENKYVLLSYLSQLFEITEYY